MRTRVSLVAWCVFILSAVAAAQVASPTVEIVPFGGYLFGGEFFKATNGFGRVEIKADDHATYGLRVGYNVTRNFQLELQASRTDTSVLSKSRESGSLVRDRVGDLKIDYLLGSGVFSLMSGRIVPYVSVGAGLGRLNPDIRSAQFAFRRTTRFTGAVGLGVKSFFTSHVGARLDARGYATRLGDTFFGVRCSDIASDCDQRRWLTNVETSGGLIVAF